MKEALPKEPILFLKPPSSLANPGQPVRYPESSSQVDHESELAIVVGKRIGPGQAADGAIFGYTCANDVTARDLQKKDGQWTRAKGLDTFCPLGPQLVQGLDVSDLAISCKVNGELRQKSRTSNMIFSPADLLANCGPKGQKV